MSIARLGWLAKTVTKASWKVADKHGVSILRRQESCSYDTPFGREYYALSTCCRRMLGWFDIVNIRHSG